MIRFRVIIEKNVFFAIFDWLQTALLKPSSIN